MRKVLSSVVISILMLLILFACSSEPADMTGDVSVRVSEHVSSRTIAPSPGNRNIVKWRIIGEYPEDHALDFAKDFNTAVMEILSLKVGSWNFKAQGIAIDDVVVAESDVMPVIISASAKAQISLKLKYRTDADGKFVAKVTIPETEQTAMNVKLSLDCLFDNSNDKQVIIEKANADKTVKVGFNSYIFDLSLPAGRYDVSFTILDSANQPIGTPYRESLHVMTARTSEFNLPWIDGKFLKVSAPVLEMVPSSNIFLPEVTIEIRKDDDVTVRYTTDGTEPTSSSSIYSSPFKLDRNTTVKAKAFRYGMIPSETITEYFTVNTPAPKISESNTFLYRPAYIKFSCCVPDAVIYYTIDGTTPSSSHGAMYDGGTVVLTDSCTLQAIAYSDGREPSSVNSISYRISKDNLDVTIKDPVLPTNFDISIVVPDAMKPGALVPVKASYQFQTRLSDPQAKASSYAWYVNGKLVENGGKDVLNCGFLPTDDIAMFNKAVLLSVRAVVNGHSISSSVYIEQKEFDTSSFVVGDTGLAGGYIFYDVDADNTPEDPDGPDNLISSSCGWRFLEAAPAELPDSCCFGYHKNGLYTNNKNQWDAENCTRSGLGEGSRNTSMLYLLMGEEAMHTIQYDTNNRAYFYAAKEALEYSNKGYNDWFLPSYDELKVLTKFLEDNNIPKREIRYWSSTEASNGIFYAMTNLGTDLRQEYNGVWPIRMF